MSRQLATSADQIESKRCPDGLDPSKLPGHIAVIMDGNGRWANARGLPRVMGHRGKLQQVLINLKPPQATFVNRSIVASDQPSPTK